MATTSTSADHSLTASAASALARLMLKLVRIAVGSALAAGLLLLDALLLGDDGKRPKDGRNNPVD